MPSETSLAHTSPPRRDPACTHAREERSGASASRCLARSPLRECRYYAANVVVVVVVVDVAVVVVGSVVVEPPGVVDRVTVKGSVDEFVPSWPTVTMVDGTVLPLEAKSNVIDGAQRVKKLRPLTPRELLNANVMSCRAADNKNEWRVPNRVGRIPTNAPGVVTLTLNVPAVAV
ncbi:MAG: hypothetical protein ACLPVY_21690 [Acidimicrobiia bacterium]